MSPVELGSLAIATIALAVSVWAVIETKRSRVAPELVLEENWLVDNDGSGEPVWRLSLVNRGDGEAYDVRVLLSGLPSEKDTLTRRPILEPGAAIGIATHLTERLQLKEMPPGIAMIRWEHRRGKVDPESLSGLIQWRQHASVGRLRKRRIRHPAAAT
jgi:hypothetical protein